MEKVAIVILIGYFLGTIQPAYILGKLIKKVDIRSLGYGNSGASNATQSLGIKFGVAVALIDILKGVVSILIVKQMYTLDFDSSGALLLYLNGYAVILGHIFPFYMNFKGGKGTASLVGILFGMNFIVGLIGILTITIATIVTDYIVLGTLALTVYVIGVTLYFNLGVGPVIIAIMGTLLSIWLHLPNYNRMKFGKESKVSSVIPFKKGKRNG